MGRFDDWEPAQESRDKLIVDLRAAALGPKGYKINPLKTSRKRRIEDEEEEQQQEEREREQRQRPQAMDEDAGGGQAPAAKRRRVVAEGEPWRTVSGKVWKGAGFKAGTYKSAVVGTTWEQKMALKAARKQFSEQKAAAGELRRDKRKAKSAERAAAKERKKVNQAKSAVVQKITNAATVKKLLKSKKQRKLIKTADTN